MPEMPRSDGCDWDLAVSHSEGQRSLPENQGLPLPSQGDTAATGTDTQSSPNPSPPAPDPFSSLDQFYAHSVCWYKLELFRISFCALGIIN